MTTKYDELSTKHREALERAEAWQQLTPKEQLASLDARLGKGQGATRQRAKIAKRLLEQKKGK